MNSKVWTVNIPEEEVIALIAYTLYLGDWDIDEEGPSEFKDDFLADLATKWKKDWLPARTAEHRGDCTKMSFPCVRCNVDKYFKDAERLYRSLYPPTKPPVTEFVPNHCNCAFYRNRQMLGGWTCPRHGHQRS
jgi:hypothetical protein